MRIGGYSSSYLKSPVGPSLRPNHLRAKCAKSKKKKPRHPPKEYCTFAEYYIDQNIGQKLRRIVFLTLGGMITFYLGERYVIGLKKVTGYSMESAFTEGDRIMFSRLRYFSADPRRYEVIIMEDPDNPEGTLIKRVIGVPGDVLGYAKGYKFFINGKLLSGVSFGESTNGEHSFTNGEIEEIIIPPDMFFVMGDERTISKDSREFGFVPKYLIKGALFLRYHPFDRIKVF